MYKKILFFFIFIILFLTSVHGMQLSINPGNLLFNGKINEIICNDINIHSDYKGNLIGDLSWLKKGNENKIKKIEFYTLNSNELNIREDFIRDIILKEASIKKEICLSFNEPGKYHGALVYKTQDSYAGVGLWTSADIKSDTKLNKFGYEKITGLFSLGIGFDRGENNMIYFVLALMVIFLTILLTLMFVRKVR